ncbi:RsmB/NOP family class I SAM-dependent RNA methyltransferase [Bdellovibrio sp. HCB337]|uniref:RsmB/NOP family class I SAM-dependent RNA methyltransferase n=1 Tax=Bdellovibrio sp. HCB337 TaxID=3394358 RepID=UPI0039A74D22
MVEHIVQAVVEIFTQNRYADKVIERTFKNQRKWGARDRRFFAESVYEIVRWWRYLGALAGFDPTKTAVDTAAVWQIWSAWCYDTHGTLPEWEETKKFDTQNFAARKESISSVAIRESVPDWLYEYGRQEFGEEWNQILHAMNQPAEVFLRANTLCGTREELLRKLKGEEIAVTPVSELDAGLKLLERKNLASSESFKQGLFEIQDGASQMVAPLLRPEPGMKVIDACAGGGGKSLHLAALMKNRGKIISMDVHAWKLESLKERARRNHVDIIETRVIDSDKVIKSLEKSADRVLLDVPCSALGVLRRNPDTKWKLTAEEVQKILILQSEILQNYSQMVKPGGLLVYATCSLMPAENERQVKKFLEHNKQDWSLVEELHTLPHREGFDGFYGALLKRRS